METTEKDNSNDSKEEQLFNNAFDKAVKEADFEIILDWFDDGYDDYGLIVI